MEKIAMKGEGSKYWPYNSKKLVEMIDCSIFKLVSKLMILKSSTLIIDCANLKIIIKNNAFKWKE